MEDPTVRRLTKKVFPHVWVRHKLMSSVPSTGIFPFSEMTVFSQGIGNAVIVYLHMYRPTLSNYLEKHIPSMPKSKEQFWTHVAFLCLQARLPNDAAFDYFLTTCAITAEVALHCYMNGYDDVLSLASVFFCAFFENELYANFHRSGGWEGLRTYIEYTSCEKLYKKVDKDLKKLHSPSAPLPYLFTIAFEPFAAARRENFMSLLTFKIGEIEREDKTNTLVSRIFHWHFMENHRNSEVKRGILKRMENVRRNFKSNIFMDTERHGVSSETDKIPDAHNQLLNDSESLCLYGGAQLSESVIPMSKKRFSNKSTQTLDASECTKVSTESNTQLCTNNKTSEKSKFSSSSRLYELCNFYESLSSAPDIKKEDSKYFKSNDEKCSRPIFSPPKELVDRHEKMNHVGRYSRSLVPRSSEYGRTFPKRKHSTPESPIKSTEPFPDDDALYEFSKSFQELGFKCLCVGNSSHLEKSATFANYAEVIEKCRDFQSKYSSIQFAILIPNNFTSETSNAPETENCDDTFSKNKNSEQLLLNMVKEYFNNCAVSPQIPHSEPDETRSEATTAHQTSRSTVTRVDGNQASLSEGNNSTTSKTSGDPKNKEPKIKFTVTKLDETKLKNDARIPRRNCTNGTPQTSRSTVTTVDGNQASSSEGNNSTTSKTSGDPKNGTPKNCPENATVYSQDNASVTSQKRVSFAENLIHYIPTYSSDESSNSITSMESLNQRFQRETQSARNSEHADNQENTSNPPTPRNPIVTERRGYFPCLSSNESQSSSDDAESSNPSSSGIFGRIFRRSTSRNSNVDEAPKENKEETKKEK